MSEEMLIEKTTEFRDIVGRIAKTPKRHGKILDALMTEFEIRRERLAPSIIVREFLGRKLKPQEGIVINSVFFSHMFGYLPTKDKMPGLTTELSYHDIFMVPIYQNDNAFLIVFHKNSAMALEYATKLQQVLGGQPPDEKYDITVTRIKVSQEVAKSENVTPQVIVDALSIMSNNEVFYVGEELVLNLTLDPRVITALAESKGYKVTVMQREKAPDPEASPEIQFFDRFIGLVISKSDEGIALGIKHHRFMAAMEKEIFAEDDYDPEKEAKHHAHHMIETRH